MRNESKKRGQTPTMALLIESEFASENREADLITRTFQQMTLAQAEELVSIKRQGLNLAMNANLKALLDHDLRSRETVLQIIGQCLAKTRRGER